MRDGAHFASSLLVDGEANRRPLPLNRRVARTLAGVEDEWVADDDLGDVPLVDPDAPVPRPTASPVRRRAAGATMLAAAMIGLQEALEGPRPEPAITEVGNSDPGDDDPVAVDLDPYDPSASVAVIRPWLHDQA